MKLGAYFWDGWYEKIAAWTPRLLNEFADRMPQWGWLSNDVENMELQIDYAADAGVSWFAFDWYYTKNHQEMKMNHVVNRFLKAKNSKRMEFCLMVANHEGFYIEREDWESFCEQVIPILKARQALCVNGIPALIFFSAAELCTHLGGVEETARCLSYLREKAREHGLPGVYVLGGEWPVRNEKTGAIVKNTEEMKLRCKRNRTAGFDAMTGYNYHRDFVGEVGGKRYLYEYENLAHDHREAWEDITACGKLPYLPVLIGGWDCRPWETKDSARSCYSPDRTGVLLANHLEEAKTWMESNASDCVENLAVIYAWNELGEGGYILPTVGDRGAMLRAVSLAMRKEE